MREANLMRSLQRTLGLGVGRLRTRTGSPPRPERGSRRRDPTRNTGCRSGRRPGGRRRRPRRCSIPVTRYGSDRGSSTAPYVRRPPRDLLRPHGPRPPRSPLPRSSLPAPSRRPPPSRPAAQCTDRGGRRGTDVNVMCALPSPTSRRRTPSRPPVPRRPVPPASRRPRRPLPPSAAKMREYRPQTTTSQSSVTPWLGSVSTWLGSVTTWLGSVNTWPEPTGGRPARSLSCSAEQRPHGAGLLERLRQGAQQDLDIALGDRKSTR